MAQVTSSTAEVAAAIFDFENSTSNEYTAALVAEFEPIEAVNVSFNVGNEVITHTVLL